MKTTNESATGRSRVNSYGIRQSMPARTVRKVASVARPDGAGPDAARVVFALKVGAALALALVSVVAVL